MSVYQPKRANGSPKSPYFHFDFVLRPSGQPKSQRFHGSTGQKTETAARRVETKLRELAALGKIGNLMTVKDACDRYWKEVGKHASSEHAREQEDHCMSELKRFYGEDTPLVAINPDAVSRAAAERADTRTVRWRKAGGELLPMPTDKLPAPATVNRQVIEPMRRVLRRAKKHWGVPIDLDQFQWGGRDGVKRAEPEERVRELTLEEEVRFWNALDDRDYELLCELYIISGKRQSNWLMLAKFKLNLDAGTVKLRKLKKRRPAEIVVELTERELEIVTEAWERSKGSEYLFTAVSKRRRDKGARRPITKQMLYDRLSATFKKAGIMDIRPHDFRHTFASRALRADPNLKKLMGAMDHSDIKSTLRYTHVMQEEIRDMRSKVTVTKHYPGNVKRLKNGGAA